MSLDSLRIQVCPKKGISPTILFFSGIGTRKILFDREGSGFLGIIIIIIGDMVLDFMETRWISEVVLGDGCFFMGIETTYSLEWSRGAW